MKWIVVAMVAACSSPVMAQENCAPTDVVSEFLDEKHGELVHSDGYLPDGSIMTVWANPSSGTWTITITNDAGITCIVADGIEYQRYNALNV